MAVVIAILVVKNKRNNCPVKELANRNGGSISHLSTEVGLA